MKKQFFIILSIVTICVVGCKKDKTTILDLKNGDYFIFGEYAGECYGDCAKFYVIKDNQLYADLNDYFFSPDSLKFISTPLTATKYNIGKPLLTDFPTFLINHKNETFGCPDCTDGGAVYLILKKNGVVSTWNIDNSIANQPEEIKDYISQVHAIIAALQ